MNNQDWKPSDEDAIWLQNLINSLKIGGKWLVPDVGVVYTRTGEKEITLSLIVSTKSRFEDVDNLVDRTNKVAEKAGIKVIIDDSTLKTYLLKERKPKHRRR